MKFIGNYIKKYKVQAMCAPLFKMLEAIFELLVPLVVAEIINHGIGNSDTHYVIMKSGVLLLLAIIGWGVAIFAQYFSARVAVYCAGDIRADLFKKIVSLSDRIRENIGEEVLITRMTSDVNQVQNGINMFLRLFLRSPFIVFGALIMATLVDFRSSVLFLVVIVLLFIIVGFIMKYTLPGYSTIQEKLEAVLRFTNENLAGARVLRAFCQGSREIESFNEKVDDLKEKQLSIGRLSGVLNPITFVVINLGIIFLIWHGGAEVNSGRLMQGEVVALVNYMSQILIELVKLANLIVLLMKAFPSAKRIEEIMLLKADERVHLDENDEVSDYQIILENVSFSYEDDDEYAIEDISITIPQGKVFGIIGGTGSGKSTLIKMINHTFDATKGCIKLGGQDICSFDDCDLDKVFGIVPQKATLFKGTIESNLCMGKSYTDEEMLSALEVAQAKDFVIKKDGTLKTYVAQGGSNFSGGQKQRLTIARALMHKPKILVLDDSASALDLGTERRLQEALMKLPWNPTIIIISQRASSLRYAQNILVLEDGRVQGIGNHEELLVKCQVYQEIYYAQYAKEAE